MASNKKKLEGIQVAIVATNGFEYVELSKPKQALEEAGATVHVISSKGEPINGLNHHEWNDDEIEVYGTFDDVDSGEYDALMLPGGVINPDALRLDPKAIEFIKDFVDADKPIAAICHGPWTLINALGVAGKRVTSWPSLQVDLENAGAEWVDEEVVVDGKLVTSRKPDDIPAFNKEMIGVFALEA